MGEKNQKSHQRKLREQVEMVIETAKELDPHPEDFVGPLLQSIRASVNLEAFDLSTPEKAKKAVEYLSSKLELLDSHRRHVRGLRQVLERAQREHDDSSEPV